MSTHASRHADEPVHPDGTRHRIVVGVDNRGRSASALVWAAEEAERNGGALVLVSAIPPGSASKDSMGEHDLGTLARRLTLADVERRTSTDTPVEALLEAASKADLLAVGCRTTGALHRLLVGSTSRTVGCWSPVPVVIVPERWIQPGMATTPLVVGVRPSLNVAPPAEEPDRDVLDFAFARAASLAVPLVVVSAWEVPTAYAWSPEDIQRARTEYDEALAARLAPWEQAHPDIEVTRCNVAEPPAQALVDASEVAQMVIVGRHHSRVFSGFLGSTARGVLHHASRPVAVVPSGTREQLVRQLDAQRVSAAAWAPTY